MRHVVLVLAAMALALLLASGVALAVNKIGTNGPDRLRGTNGEDNLLGRRGNDILIGLGGSDNLLGGPGKDIVLGSRGGDAKLLGGSGNDGIIAGQGSDIALGERGNDFLLDGSLRESSHDNFSGGVGNDLLWVSHVPAFEDTVVCGRGFDRVGADPKDVVAPDCEKVTIIRNAAQDEEFFEAIPQSVFDGLHPQFPIQDEYPQFPIQLG
jgi:RTX calcium-binding nonapeptide repeat (4 copies)